jgi:thiol reductant ABC exporter CydC subunit
VSAPLDTGRTQTASTSRTLALVRPAAGRLALAALLGAGALAASLGLLGTSAWLISRAAQHPPESALALAIVGVQFFGLSRGFLRYGERLVGHDAAFRLLVRLRVRVYRRLEQLAPAGLPAFGRGDLLARVVDDVDSLQDIVLRVLLPFVVSTVVGVAAALALWLILPAAGLTFAAALLVSTTLVPWACGRMAARQEAGQATERGDLADAVVDLVEGAPELVVFGALADQVARVERADGELRATARRGAATRGLGLALALLAMGGACVGGLAFGVAATHDRRLDGVVLAVLAVVPLAALELVSPLPAAAQSLQRSRRAAGRVFAVCDAPVPVPDPARPRPAGPGPHELRLSAVSVRYPGSVRDALSDIDLDVGPGRRVAVVGPSGAGKSTLADVCVRFVAVTSGQATLDGTPVEQLAADDLRRVVGLVAQGPHLFDTTIAENLRLARRSATDTDLAHVLARVGLGDWLATLPDGLGTEAGVDGSRLSGGQRQRLALARALLADFPILILDEPGEHLEPAAADELMDDALRVTEGRSTLVITHRLQGLECVDEVVFLEGGRVVERGTHEELLALGRRYARWWWDERMQDGLGRRHLGTEPTAIVASVAAGR